MNILLFILASVITMILMPIGIIFGFFKQVRKATFKKAWGDINTKFLNMAVAMDKYGNVVCAELLNATMIHSSKDLFGNHRQTVSHVIGLNESTNTLTGVGKTLNRFLNWLDNNHSVDSIEDTID